MQHSVIIAAKQTIARHDPPPLNEIMNFLKKLLACVCSDILRKLLDVLFFYIIVCAYCAVLNGAFL